MDTTLYYTFSTISQTLAGAIGLLGAFLVYYFSRVDQELRGHLRQLASYYPNATETVDLQFMLEENDVPGLLAYFREDKLRQLEMGDGLAPSLYLGPAERLYRGRSIVASKAQFAVYLTCATIAMSLISLATAPQLALIQPRYLTAILLAGVLLATACIIQHAQIVLGVLRG